MYGGAGNDTFAFNFSGRPVYRLHVTKDWYIGDVIELCGQSPE